MAFGKVERRHGLTADEAERLAYPNGRDRHLWEFLQRAHDANRRVLDRYGYHCPRPSGNPGDLTYLSGYPADVARIREPAAQNAADVIATIGELARALRTGDAVSIALKGLELGAAIGRERFHDYQRRLRSTGGQIRGEQARAEQEAFRAWAWPLFDEAHTALGADGKRRIGRDALALRARRLAIYHKIPEERRERLTKKAAREYLTARRDTC